MPWGTRAASSACHLFVEVLVHITNQCLPPEYRGFIIHYIDDIMFGGRDYKMCKLILDTFLQVCKTANVEIKQSKTQGPTPQLVMIGFDYFCNQQSIGIDTKRKNKLLNKLNVLIISKNTTYKWLESLIGELEFCAPLLFPLKACIRRFRNALPKVRNPIALIKVDNNIIDEANLWLQFLPILNNVPVTELLYTHVMDTVVTTDASDWGFGCFWPPHWFRKPFTKQQVNPNNINNISDRELMAIHWVVFHWGPKFSGKRVLFYTDNQSIFWELCKKYSKDSIRNTLIRQLMVQCAKFRFAFYIDWTPRDNNQFADFLSKNDMINFYKLCKFRKVSLNSTMSIQL